MDRSKTPRYTAISGHSTEITPQAIAAWLTSLEAASRAKRTASPGAERAQAPRLTSGPTPQSAFAALSPDGCTWRTCQGSLLTPTGSPESCVTFTPSGMMRGGVCYALGTLAPGISAPDSGSSGAAAREPLPTVIASDSDGGRGDRAGCRSGTLTWRIAQARELLPTVTVNGNHNARGASPSSGDGLATVARRTLPTVVSSDHKGSSAPLPRRRTLAEEVTGQTLSADFCEWHMGAPVGWGDLAPLPVGAVEAWEEAARGGALWWTPPPMTALKGQEPRRAARIRQAGNAWVPVCAWVAFDLLSDDF